MPNSNRLLVIGDVQGCAASLLQLLKVVGFNSDSEELWLAGDLVNRGPASAEVLRWVRDHQSAVKTVLGNHDLHLLACAAGVRSMKLTDTLADVLTAPDRDDLIDWLRRQPLTLSNDEHCLVHAGIHPDWSVALLQRLAERAQQRLRGEHWCEFLKELVDYSGTLAWTAADNEHSELALVKAVKIMTTIRCCNTEGALDTAYNGPADACAVGTKPWFMQKRRQPLERKIIFGHWAALGFYQDQHVIGLDTGCVWGRTLTAYDCRSGETWSTPCMDVVVHQRLS